jgi:hypothetical protein
MHYDEDRYTRQRRLREIGDAGQERLAAARITVGGRAESRRAESPGQARESAAVVELVYLHRAGVGSVAIDALATPRAFVHAAIFQNEAARRHAAGAWRALRSLVEISHADGGARS